MRQSEGHDAMDQAFAVVKEAVAVFKDAVLASAAIVAAYVGFRGLGTWRRQLRGNAEYQLAKSMLTVVYELRECIGSVRHPLMQHAQEPDLPPEKLEKLSQREKEWHALAQAYQKRWEPIPVAKAKLEANLLEAEAVWGRELLTRVAPLNALIVELLVAIEEHLEAQNPKMFYESPEPEETKKRRGIMYARGDSEKDEFRKRLDQTVRDIEDELRPHILKHHR